MAEISEKAPDKLIKPGFSPDFSEALDGKKGLVQAQPSGRDSHSAMTKDKALKGFPQFDLVKGTDRQSDKVLQAGSGNIDDKTLVADFDKLAKRAGADPLNDDQKKQIENMSPAEKKMYRLAMNELNNLADGKISPADYMTRTIKNAATLAEENGRKPDSWNIFKSTPAELYRDYVGLVFSEKSLGFSHDLGRSVAGGGFNPAGSALEKTYQRLIVGKAAEGFNTNVTDVDPNNSVTHHYREVLMVGFANGRFVGDQVTSYLDKPGVNPGDVRNGYFASMIGDALADGKLKPTEAADLTAWAYTKHGGAQPSWGDANKAGNFVDTDDYKIDKWLLAYRSSAGK